MKWLELSVECAPEFVEPASEIFRRYGEGGVAVEEPGGFNPDEGETAETPRRVTVKTYVSFDSDTGERRCRIDLAVRLLAQAGAVTQLSERVLDEEEWRHAWKEHFQVLHIGGHIRVVPSWRRYRPKRHDVVVKLDPGLAFGTGHHPTTRMCLELLEEKVLPGAHVLDVGCGSGILSIAAARLGAARVLGLDVDATATKVAELNMTQNGTEQTVRILKATLPHPEVPRQSQDLVVANISAKVVLELSDALVSATRPGGTLIVSGVLLDKKGEVQTGLEKAGGFVQQTKVDEDWIALVTLV